MLNKIYGDTRVVKSLIVKVKNSKDFDIRLKAYNELKKYKNTVAQECVALYCTKMEDYEINLTINSTMDSEEVIKHFRDIGWKKDYNSGEIQCSAVKLPSGKNLWYKEPSNSPFTNGQWG